MKILHIIDSLNVGGAERDLVTLVDALERVGIQGAFYLLYENGPLRRLVSDGCPVFTAFDRPITLVGIASRLKPDLLQTWVADGAILAAVPSLVLGIPHIHRIPNIPSMQFTIHPRGDSFLHRFRLALQSADRVIAVSDTAALDAVSFFGIAVPTVVYNGFPLVRAKKRFAGGIPEGRIVITSVGRLSVEKGHRFLIEALSGIVSSHPSVLCLIAGDGPLETELQAQIRKLGLQDHVKLLGYREDIFPILNRTDIFVMPSLYEGFCDAVVEALVAGRCVVASDLPVIRSDIVGGTGEGIRFCRPGSSDDIRFALADLLEHKEVRRAMGLHAQKIAARFRIDTMVSCYVQLYEEVQRGRQSKPARGPRIRRSEPHALSVGPNM